MTDSSFESINKGLPAIRVDQQLIARMVPIGSRVLEIGCNNGDLLVYLTEARQVRGHGLEISLKGVQQCLAKGLSVIQGDADRDLVDYPDNAFDCVILSQTIQATGAPHEVLAQLARISGRLIISFPNFAYWRVRWQLMKTGKMPVNSFLSYQWYDTPNIHLCTIKDFVELVQKQGLKVSKLISLSNSGQALPQWYPRKLSNWMAEQAVFLLEHQS